MKHDDESGRLGRLAQQKKHQMQFDYAQKHLNILTEEAAKLRAQELDPDDKRTAEQRQTDKQRLVQDEEQMSNIIDD